MIKSESKIEQPDNLIIHLCRIGDSEAFRKLVEMMQQYAYNLAFRILQNKADSQDAVQESFIKIWKRFDQYNSKHLFSTWMYKIVMNTCLDKIKSSKRFIKYQIENDHRIYDSETQIVNKDLADLILKFSTKLPRKQRLVFIMKDLENLSIEEISIILNVKKGIVKSNLYYARKNIREKVIKLDNGRQNHEL